MWLSSKGIIGNLGLGGKLGYAKNSIDMYLALFIGTLVVMCFLTYKQQSRIALLFIVTVVIATLFLIVLVSYKSKKIALTFRNILKTMMMIL